MKLKMKLMRNTVQMPCQLFPGCPGGRCQKLFDERLNNNFQSSPIRDIGNLACRLNLVYFEGIPVFKPLPEFQYEFKKDNIITFDWNFDIQQITAWRFINDR